MDNQTLRVLLDKLNTHCGLALEAAAGFASSRGHWEITLEHLLLKLLEESKQGHIDCILKHYDVDQDALWYGLLDNLDEQPAAHQGKPALSPLLYQILERACLANSLHYTPNIIDSAGLLDAVIQMSMQLPGRDAFRPLERVNLEQVHQQFSALTAASEESPSTDRSQRHHSAVNGRDASAQTSDVSALEQFTTNLTAKAENDGMDPICGRNDEIRMAIDILCRRRKNNPILVGEPGVGKTAIVEGLAQKIVAGEVPDLLKGIQLCVLDLGMLQAGAGVKGEFERRLKQVIEDVQQASPPVMLFIDEAHTLVGAGGEAGMSDAANLLKPALARGELRTVAATTWSEYKKYFERDPALARRFQMVQVDEPSTEAALHMLSGLKASYEKHHNTLISDDALEAAVHYSNRYITGRYLPDKAIDLIDTAAARVRMGQVMPPQQLEAIQARIRYLEDRLRAVANEQSLGLTIDPALLERLSSELTAAMTQAQEAESAWQEQSQLVKVIQQDGTQLQAHAASTGDSESLTELLALSQLRRESLARIQVSRPWVQPEVNALAVADVVADWTGIPVGSMVKDELHNLLTFEDSITEQVIGQDAAIHAIGKNLRASKAGLRTTDGPLGVFLLAGPSGVGKTETACATASQLFGSEHALITINMSEYQEAHTVSQLKGSPPGYVGYGEGGILTEALRRRPYSVVLLDEVEKAHPDVMNLFYQVFDRGIMRDGEGREIDCRNAVFFLTSNLGADAIQQRFEQPEIPEDEPVDTVTGEHEDPAPDLQGAEDTPDDASADTWQAPSFAELCTLVRPAVLQHFAPALVARMQLLAFNSLSDDALQRIVALKLDKLAQRLASEHRIQLQCDEQVMADLAAQCRLNDSGARYVNALLEQQLLPGIAGQILTYLVEDDMPDTLRLNLDDQGELICTFADFAPQPSASNADPNTTATAGQKDTDLAPAANHTKGVTP